MFVLGVADSSQPSMCDTELMLEDLQKNFDEKKFTYPVTKKGKTERKQMTVARIDAADKKQLEKFRAIGVEFGLLPQVLVVKDGELFRYDGLLSSFDNILFMMQILAKPLVELKYEDHIMDFLDTSEPGMYADDYKNGLLNNNMIMKNFNGYVQNIGYMTRVVAMYYGKDEYEDEINALTKIAGRLSARMNLRIAIVTDKDLINKMKKKYPNYFDVLSKSSMILRRYDGETFTHNLSSEPINTYSWFINVRSKKVVDRMNHGGYQLGEISGLPMIILYLSFDKSKPQQYKRCQDAIEVLTKIAPMFESQVMVFYADEEHQLSQRKNLGITWDTLPAMALNSLHHTLYVYDRNLPFDMNNVE